MAITRFFQVKPNESVDFQSTVTPDNDVLPLDTFRNSKEVYRDAEKVIVHVLLSDQLLADIDQTLNATRLSSTDYTDVDSSARIDPLSIEGMQALDIQGSYCGEEYSAEPVKGLFSYFPELAGKKVVGQDEDGNNIETDIVLRHTWAGATI